MGLITCLQWALPIMACLVRCYPLMKHMLDRAILMRQTRRPVRMGWAVHMVSRGEKALTASPSLPVGIVGRGWSRRGERLSTFCFDSNHVLLRLELHSASTRITFCFDSNHILFRLESHAVSTRITCRTYCRRIAWSRLGAYRNRPHALRPAAFAPLTKKSEHFQAGIRAVQRISKKGAKMGFFVCVRVHNY